jgi:hypothetical protein
MSLTSYRAAPSRATKKAVSLQPKTKKGSPQLIQLFGCPIEMLMGYSKICSLKRLLQCLATPYSSNA